MDITTMKKEDFDLVPLITDKDIKKKFTGVILIPREEIHESGLACISYVLCNHATPICRIESGSDVIHLDGIGGYGDWYPGLIPDKIDCKGWSIDCLPCGYLRIFARKNLHINDFFGSDFEIYCD